MDYTEAIGWRFASRDELEASKTWYIENGLSAEFFDDELRLSLASSKDHDRAKTLAVLEELLAKYPKHGKMFRSMAAPGLFGVE